MSDCRFEESLPAAPESVPRLRRAVTSFATTAGASDGLGLKVALAVSEACTNVVIHAYRRAGVPGEVAVTAERRDGALWVEISDWGEGMRPRADSPGLGLGTPLMATLADHLEICDNPGGRGTVVRLEFGL